MWCIGHGRVGVVERYVAKVVVFQWREKRRRFIRNQEENMYEMADVWLFSQYFVLHFFFTWNDLLYGHCRPHFGGLTNGKYVFYSFTDINTLRLAGFKQELKELRVVPHSLFLSLFHSKVPNGVLAAYSWMLKSFEPLFNCVLSLFSLTYTGFWSGCEKRRAKPYNTIF